MSTEDTTIDCVPDDALKEIMLLLPTPAALVHAALASKSWRRIMAVQQFLGEYRKRHPSSPLIGLYIPQEFGGLPSFLIADSIRSVPRGSRDQDLVRAAEKAFSLDGLEGHSKWRILDCHNGRLLLARGDEAIEVYNPFSLERITVSLPQDHMLPANFSACLLQGHGDDVASFRVVSLQQRRDGRIRMVHAVAYDSRTRIWTNHLWKTLQNIEGSEQVEMMHAGGLIFCKCMSSLVLMLDTRSMNFSSLPLPTDNNPKNYAIGEMEDGSCCLVSTEFVGLKNNMQLRMWMLENLEWKLEKEMQVKRVLGNHTHYPYFRVRAVANGVALLCSNKRHLHFVIDLKTFNVKEKFEFADKPAYLLQMPWPPTFSVAVGNGSTEDKNHGTIYRGIQEADTPTRADVEKTKSGDAKCILNRKESLIPCNVDAVLLDCSSPNMHLEGSTEDKNYGTIYSGIQEADTPTRGDVEKTKSDDVECPLSTNEPLICCNVDVVLLSGSSPRMHLEATTFHDPEKKKSSISSPGARQGRSPSPSPRNGSTSTKARSPSPPPKKASPPRTESPPPESVVLHIKHLSRNNNEARLKEIFASLRRKSASLPQKRSPNPLIPCNVDAVLLGCSSACMHLEATRFHAPEKRKSLTRSVNGSYSSSEYNERNKRKRARRSHAVQAPPMPTSEEAWVVTVGDSSWHEISFDGKTCPRQVNIVLGNILCLHYPGVVTTKSGESIPAQNWNDYALGTDLKYGSAQGAVWSHFWKQFRLSSPNDMEHAEVVFHNNATRLVRNALSIARIQVTNDYLKKFKGLKVESFRQYSDTYLTTEEYAKVMVSWLKDRPAAYHALYQVWATPEWIAKSRRYRECGGCIRLAKRMNSDRAYVGTPAKDGYEVDGLRRSTRTRRTSVRLSDPNC